MENRGLKSEKVYLRSLELHILVANILMVKQKKDAKDVGKVILPSNLQGLQVLLPVENRPNMLPKHLALILILTQRSLTLHPLGMTLTPMFLLLPKVNTKLQLLLVPNSLQLPQTLAYQRRSFFLVILYLNQSLSRHQMN